MGFSIIIWFFWAIFKMPLDIKNAKRHYTEEVENVESELSLEKENKYSIKEIKIIAKYYYVVWSYMFFNSYLIYLSLNILFVILGIVSNEFFFSFLLLDIIDRSPVLTNVTRSITVNSKQLLMTFVLGIVLIYIYSMIGYYTTVLRGTFVYENSPNLPVCNNPIQCFAFVLNIGLRFGGGIGEAIEQPDPDKNYQAYIYRFFYDLTFFMIIAIIWLNIIFGIIIDTFAELRDAKNAKGY